jgi:hypothetical protein
LREDGIEYEESKGYEKIGLDKILHISEKRGGKLDFMFARQIAPYNIETILALLYIKKIIDEYSDKVKEVNLDILQWGDDKFSFGNDEKRIYVIPQMLYSKSQYPIAAVKSKDELEEYSESMRKLKEYKGKIGYIYLDVNKIIEMIEKTGLEYMKESLKYLEDKGKVTKIKIKTEKGEEIKAAVNILDFWGLTTLYYIVEVSKHIFGINDYEIKEFEDKIELVNKKFKDGIEIVNKVEYNISGYKLTFEYKGKELRFRVYDASHIYEGEDKIYKEENEKYKEEKINSYIALAVLSGSGYILLEEDSGKPSVDQKIKEFYMKAKDGTGYDILLFELDEQKLIESGIIREDDYVKFVSKDKIKKTIDTISKIYGI